MMKVAKLENQAGITPDFDIDTYMKVHPGAFVFHFPLFAQGTCTASQNHIKLNCQKH